jgi:WD40 repeat protein
MSLTAFQTLTALLTVLPAAKPEPPLPVPPAPVDLPPGAVVRYGSTSFRNQERLTDVSYTPDGRTLVTGTAPEGSGNGHLVFWNTATGTKRFESEPQSGMVVQVTCSPDGRTVGVLHQGKSQVSIYSATTGKLLRHVGQRTHGQPAFSPDGKTVGSPVREGICLWDVDTGEEVQRLEMQEGASQVRWIMFSPKGHRLASIGPERSLRLWDLDTGEVLLRVDDIEGRWSYVDFSPDGSMVGIMSGETLILWDTADGHEIRRYPTDPDGQGFAITPDGKTLILVARTTGEIREVESGKRLHYFGIGSTGRLPSWSVTPDGRTLAVVCGCVVNQWDVATGENKNVSPGHRFPITAVAVARDGKSVITQDTAGGVRIWDPTTGRELRKLQAPKDAVDVLPFAPHGRSPYFCCVTEDGVLRLVEVETGRERSQIKDLGGERRSLATSADGALLAVLVVNGEGTPEVGIWETATGKSRKRLAKVPPELSAIALSADGTRVAGVTREAIHIWDAATGREVRTFAVEKEVTVQAMHFSADGRRLLGIGQNAAVAVWETDTGRQLMTTRLDGEALYAAALSPDGRTVAVCPLESRGGPGPVILLETATGQERCRVNGHLRLDTEHVFAAHGIAFTPDGRSLITIGLDSTAVVWSLPYRAGDSSGPRRADELAPLWEALGEAETAKAYSGLGALAAAPDLVVPFLRERLRPVPPLDPKARAQMARWVAELDSDDFDTREKAAASLERLEELAAPALKKALEGEPSAELRRQVSRLLEKLAAQPRSPEIVRNIRAIETLERVATPEALKLLDELAKGAPEAWRTHEAAEALARLKARG